MKRYLVFKFYTTSDCNIQSGGWDHFIGDFDFIDQAIEAGKPVEDYQEVQIVFRDTKQIILQGDPAKEFL